MEAVLNCYENLLITPTNKVYPKSQSSSLYPCKYLSQNNYQQSRKRPTSSHQRQYKNEEGRMLSMIKNVLNSGVDYVHDVYCECPPRSLRNNCKKEGNNWRDEQMVMAGIAGTMEIHGETAGKYIQHRKGQTWSSRQRGEKSNEKYDLKDHEDNDSRYTSGTLRFNLAQYEDLKKMDSKRVEDDQKEQTKKKSSILKTCSLQTSLKTKHIKDVSKPKVSTIDDYSKDKDLATEDQSTCKQRKQSATRQDSPCSRPNEESTSNEEEVREDSYRELIVKDKDQDSSYRKNIFAGGDLDLRTTKSHILGVIDKALSKNFVTSLDQQKNAESSEGLMEEGICIGIARTLQADCCQPLAEDLFNHCESREEYIQKLKILKWEYMKLIQNEFRKLWKLQQFLDNYSPRQPLAATFQPHSSPVEQRTEEWQQQQHEEKHKNLGKIS
ncbi:PREDICTED: uncharacterized protein LOC108575150 [Habropoda laboriosa]|nr:PREDICTED: uncharacterized protein LOC108575150 [Habropoda laboriosa]